MSPIQAAKQEASIRILVIDNTPMDCQLMTDALGRCPGFDVKACPAMSEEVISVSAKNAQVAVICNDAHDTNKKSYAVVRRLRLAHPAIRSIMLLDSTEGAAVVEAFRSGAKGVFCRNDSFESLCKCIRQVNSGQRASRPPRGRRAVLNADNPPVIRRVVPGRWVLVDREVPKGLATTS